MGRSMRKELIRLRHEKMAGREKQSADEVTSCICLLSGRTRPEAEGRLWEGQCHYTFGFIKLIKLTQR